MPRKGLNIPIVTALDDAGSIIESDQRNIINHTIQQGRGADSLFISGTTGEFNRISNRQRQQLLAICIEEIRCANSFLPETAAPIEAWAGVTAFDKAKTLENLELAKQLKADMAVISPLTIADLSPAEIVKFFENDVAAILGSNESLAIGLYDNPDIADSPDKIGNLPVPIIDALRKLPFVVCLKASTSKKIFQTYIEEFSADGDSSGFQIYSGNAGLIFELDEMQQEAGVGFKSVAGVVSGTANLFPAEWQQAWSAVIRHETERANAYRNAFAAFEKLTVFAGENGKISKLIAGIKQGLYFQGIISSPHVADGTPALTKTEAETLNVGLLQVLETLRRTVNPQSLSKYA